MEKDDVIYHNPTVTEKAKELEKKMHEAVKVENYELAARLRDQRAELIDIELRKEKLLQYMMNEADKKIKENEKKTNKKI